MRYFQKAKTHLVNVLSRPDVVEVQVICLLNLNINQYVEKPLSVIKGILIDILKCCHTMEEVR